MDVEGYLEVMRHILLLLLKLVGGQLLALLLQELVGGKLLALLL